MFPFLSDREVYKLFPSPPFTKRMEEPKINNFKPSLPLTFPYQQF